MLEDDKKVDANESSDEAKNLFSKISDESDSPASDSASDEASSLSDSVVLDESDDDPSYKWFAIHTSSGYERKVMEQLKLRLLHHGYSDRLKEVFVPEEDVVEVKKGKRKVSKRKFFPGYMLVRMKMDENVLYIVRNTPRVTGFLGDTKDPTPLDDKDVQNLKSQMKGTLKKPRSKYEFDVGETVRIIDGPFVNFSGKLDDVNIERGKVKVMVSIFGRPTPVELTFPQIEKV